VCEADLVVIAAPVAQLAQLICDVATECPPNCLITDAGSTKARLIAEVERRRGGVHQPPFVGSHPLAGDHHTGAAHARSDLFEGNTVVVTPTSLTMEADVAAIDQFWEALGAIVVHMSPEAHDVAMAATSHLPHFVAFALAQATPAELGPLAGSGWRDTTRVAAADPELWQQIFAANDTAVLAALGRFEKSLARLRQALADHDEAALVRLLQEAKQTRDAVGN
jgi:prephenate dehydrogenase